MIFILSLILCIMRIYTPLTRSILFLEKIKDIFSLRFFMVKQKTIYTCVQLVYVFEKYNNLFFVFFDPVFVHMKIVEIVTLNIQDEVI